MPEKRRQWGQFYTPPDVADLVLGFCLRRPQDRLLDPSCGHGAFLARAARYQGWLENSGVTATGERLWGVEIDPAAAAVARQSLAKDGFSSHILVQDFFSLEPGKELSDSFDCVVGNPPYTRSEWLGQVADDADYKEMLAQSAAPLAQLGRRSGLYAYFFVHGSKFLRPRGRFGFVVSNSWLDVDYGAKLKQFLLEHFKIIAIIEPAAERWFSQAEVNTCLVILEKSDDQAARAFNQVRFVRLRRPLRELFPSLPDSPSRAVEVESLIMRLLPGRSRLTGDLPVRVIPQSGLQAERKWGPYLRAPEVYFQTRSGPKTVQLGEIASVRRGQTTGANRFFYLSPEQVTQWGIEAEFTCPLLKSPKEIDTVQVNSANLGRRALVVRQERDALAGTNVLRYIEWGESQGYHRRTTCARRPLWYSLPEKGEDGCEVFWAKGIWNRHFAPLLDGKVVTDQQFYMLMTDPDLVKVFAALLNSTWVALQAELLGRSNFGEGVLWMAGYEVSKIQLPDPYALAPAERNSLEDALTLVAETRILPISEQVSQSAQQALDTVVFDLLNLAPSEREAVVEAAVELTESRIKRARAGRGG